MKIFLQSIRSVNLELSNHIKFSRFYDQTQLIDKSLKLMDAINIPPEIIDFPEIHLEIS